MHDLPISVIDRVISPIREDMRSFAKIKPSRKFPTLQYYLAPASSESSDQSMHPCYLMSSLVALLMANDLWLVHDNNATDGTVKMRLPICERRTCQQVQFVVDGS